MGAKEAPTVEPQRLANVPESPQSAREALPASLPIPPELPGNWWQALHYGSREAMLSPRDATLAPQLIARELGVNCDGSDFTKSVRSPHIAQDAR